MNLDSLEKALGWAEYLESHMRRIYSLGINAARTAANELAKHLKKKDLPDGFTMRMLYRKGWSGLTERDQTEQALGILIDLGWLKEESLETGGRSTTLFFINPAIYR